MPDELSTLLCLQQPQSLPYHRSTCSGVQSSLPCAALPAPAPPLPLPLRLPPRPTACEDDAAAISCVSSSSSSPASSSTTPEDSALGGRRRSSVRIPAVSLQVQIKPIQPQSEPAEADQRECDPTDACAPSAAGCGGCRRSAGTSDIQTLPTNGKRELSSSTSQTEHRQCSQWSRRTCRLRASSARVAPPPHASHLPHTSPMRRTDRQAAEAAVQARHERTKERCGADLQHELHSRHGERARAQSLSIRAPLLSGTMT